MPQGKVIGVYGGAGIEPGTPDYAEGVALGELLGAVSEGAAKGGGRVVGVTVGLFRERGLIPNPHLHEEIELPSLAERLNYLITQPDAYIVMKGGVGTLAELALAWSLMQVAEVPTRPLVCIGQMWRVFAESFAANSTTIARDYRYLTLVNHITEVVPALESWWANPPVIPHRQGDLEKPPLLGDEPHDVNVHKADAHTTEPHKTDE
jgi:predicted Rossmann-fold nucleotide-binding protein